MEEVAPGRFIVNNPQLTGILKREGTFKGRMFEMTTWRRDGLLARLREREFSVKTLEDTIATLPQPPGSSRLGRSEWRPQATASERISVFDPHKLTWRLLELEQREGQPGWVLRAGWVLRRRKGRGGPATYYRVTTRRNTLDLEVISENEAMLRGYATAMAEDNRPLIVERRGERLLLPDVELPPGYRAVLRQIAEESDEGPLTDERGWPLARDLFDRLGVALTIDREPARR